MEDKNIVRKRPANNDELELTPVQLLKYSRMECKRLRIRIGEMQSEIDELKDKLDNCKKESELYKFNDVENELVSYKKKCKELASKNNKLGAELSKQRSMSQKLFKRIRGIVKQNNDVLESFINKYETPKPTIVCIVGASGSGKTTLANEIERLMLIPQIVSYTTRPMREGEVDGREHWFVTEAAIPSPSKRLAYTLFGGNHYWTTIGQIKEDIQTYVIDEDGVRFLTDNFGDMFNIVCVNVTRDEELLIEQVGFERVERDKQRTLLAEEDYFATISNNDTLKTFLWRGINVISDICKEYDIKHAVNIGGIKDFFNI